MGDGVGQHGVVETDLHFLTDLVGDRPESMPDDLVGGRVQRLDRLPRDRMHTQMRGQLAMAAQP